MRAKGRALSRLRASGERGASEGVHGCPGRAHLGALSPQRLRDILGLVELASPMNKCVCLIIGGDRGRGRGREGKEVGRSI